MNVLHAIINTGLPYIVCVLEIMGAIVIFLSACHAFFLYFENAVMNRKFDIQSKFTQGLLTGLEFLMTGEIFKTILVQTFEEFCILGGIIILRVSLTVLLHYESKWHSSNEGEAEKNENVSSAENTDKPLDDKNA